MSQSLYDLTDNALHLEALLEQVESGADAAILQDALAANETELEAKAESYVKYMRSLDAQAEMCKNEALFFAKKQKAAENRSERLKAALFGAMEALGKTKLRAGAFSISIEGNGGKVPLDIDPDALVPADFQKVLVEWDKDAVRIALEAGQEVPGASLGERGRGLRVR